MKRKISVLLSLIWVLTLVLQAIPVFASGDTATSQEQFVLRIEGEKYNPDTLVGTLGGDKAAVIGNSTELSNNDLLYFKSATGAAIPASGYIAEYQVNVPVSGTYGLEIMAAPIGMNHVSPYQIKINDGNYFDVTSSVATKIGQINSPANLCYKYKLNPVTLHEGANTISFRILKGRPIDGRIFFFLDYLELTKLSWGLNKITTNASNNLFEEQDEKQATIEFTDTASMGHTLDYKVEDYDGQVVVQNSVTLNVYGLSYSFALPALQRGHYTITAEADHNGKPIMEYFSVVMNSSERRAVADSPFAMDVGGGSLFPAAEAANYARMIRLTGVNYIRERMHWNSVSSASGAYNFSKYDPYNQAYADNGIRVLELNHIAPTWARDTDKKLPRSLMDAYNLAKTSVQHYGTQSDWEFWNEPDIDYTAESEAADQYAAFLKATTIAARDSGVPTTVALAGIASPPGGYMELLMQNDVAAYIDAYNYHAHRSDNDATLVPAVPPSFAAHPDFIQGYGLEGKLAYLTEAGMYQKFADSTQTLTADQLRMQARYLTTSTIQSIASGVDKHFWFCLPYLLEYGNSWGSISTRGTPYPSVNAEAAITYALGEGVYLGQLSGLPQGVKGYVFRDGTDSVAAYWSENNTPLTLSADSSTALLTDIMGREQQLTSGSGSYALVSGPDVHYLRISGSFPGLTTPVYGTPAAHAPELTAAQRVVLTQKYPESTAAKAKAKGYLLDKTAATDIQVDAYNFNDTPMSGVVTGSVYGGWSLAVPSQTVTVAPYSKATLTFTLTGSDAVAPDVKAPVAFQGVFNGEATSKSVTLVASNENPPVTPSLIVPDYDNPSLWAANISAGSTSTFTSPAPGEIQFDYSFGGGDKWTYPYFTLPAGTTFAGTEGVTFDVYFPAPIDTVVIRSMMTEQNQSGYFTPGSLKPTGGWQQVKMPWADFAANGLPDDNFHLDPQYIRKLSIGINSKGPTEVSFKVRNIGVYTQPDSGLYSKITNLVPAHNQEVMAGTVAITAELVQGEIPVPVETVKVLVDGATVAHQVDGQTITASTVLLPGTHNVTVKAFDVNGRLISVKSSVTAVAGAPEEPGSGEPGTEQPGTEQPDTVAPTAPVLSLDSKTATSLSVSWTAATDNAGVARYTLLLNGTELAGAAANATVTDGVYRYTFQGLASGTAYRVQVQAWDRADNHSVSNDLSATTSSSSSVTSTVITESKSADKAVKKVTANDLKPTGENTLVVAIPTGTERLELGAELFGKLNGQALQIETGKVSLVIPPKTLQPLVGAEQAYKSITIGVKELGDYTQEQSLGLSSTKARWGGSLMPVGKPVELTLYAVDAGNRQVKMDSFAAPVTITFTYEEQDEPELLGIYYWNDSTGAPEYVRSTRDVDKRTITASLEHFSTYSLLAYAKDYADVTKENWVYPAVRGLTAAHVVEGDDANHFAPERPVTRVEFITLLVRALGLEKGKAGITIGKAVVRFAPGETITREEMAVMLVRALRYTGGMPVSGETGNSPAFADRSSISEWAAKEMKEAAAAGLLSGYEDGTVRPQGLTTRGEAAQVLWRMID